MRPPLDGSGGKARCMVGDPARRRLVLPHTGAPGTDPPYSNICSIAGFVKSPGGQPSACCRRWPGTTTASTAATTAPPTTTAVTDVCDAITPATSRPTGIVPPKLIM